MNINTFKKSTYSTFMVLFLLIINNLFSQTVLAGTLDDALVDGTINLFEDQDREGIIDIDNNGAMSIGDVFIGWVRLDGRSVPVGVGFEEDDVYAFFSLTLSSIDSTLLGDQTRYELSFVPTAKGDFDLGTLIGTPVPDNSISAVYESVGINLVAASPGDVDGDGRLTLLDYAAKISAAELDLIAGFGSEDDHWSAKFTVFNSVDPVANLAVLNVLTLISGIPGTASFHAGLSVLVNNTSHAFMKSVPDFVENAFLPSKHDLTVQNGDLSGASDLIFPGEGNPLFASLNGFSVYGISTNADYAVFSNPPKVVGNCRLTGGNATVSPIIGSDNQNSWTYLFEDFVEEQIATGYRVTTGGQINAPSGNTPPAGHWTHTQHGGANGNFTFLAGTASAPDGTGFTSVECADPGWCVQARCAPFKQIFWKGVGYFANQSFSGVFPGCDVRKGNKGTQHYVEYMAGDFGENNSPTRQLSLVDADPESCNWLEKVQNAGHTTPPFDVNDAVPLDSAPDDMFGDKGGQVCDSCPDYYQVRIFCGATEASKGDEIYHFEGFLNHGNFQLHPGTGEQCPVVEELVPELFEDTSSSNGNGKGKNK